MSDKHNSGLKKDYSTPLDDEPSDDQDESLPKSYYYDDATGYEVYNEECDDQDEEEGS